jgi:choline dehydrogenase-like flavoprotein
MTNFDVADLPSRVTVAIVGGGMAGLELAVELDRRGHVGALVLEAGPASDARHVAIVYPRPKARELCSQQPESDEFFRRSWVSRSAPSYDKRAGIRIRLGGRSLYWWGLVLPVEQWALCEPWWPTEIIDDLCRSWQGGDSLYERVAKDLGTPLMRHVPVGQGTAESITIAGRVFGPTPRAFRGTHARWAAYSPLDYWRDPETGEALRGNGGVDVACGCEIVEVVVEGGRATGVRVRRAGIDHIIHADAVVLCAGTIDSGRLAIDALTRAEPIASASLCGLTDHIVQEFKIDVDSTGIEDCPIGPGTFTAVGGGSTRSNFFLDVDAADAGRLSIGVRAVGEQLPGPDSVLERGPAPGNAWLVRAALGDRDREVIAAQRTALDNLWDALCTIFSLDHTPLVFPEFGARRAEGAVDPAPGRGPVTGVGTLGTIQHEGGLLRIGDVLGTDHQFTSVPGLYAAGPATFPRMGAANPTLTTLALARRLAASLAPLT